MQSTNGKYPMCACRLRRLNALRVLSEETGTPICDQIGQFGGLRAAATSGTAEGDQLRGLL
jgi:hypothetical protein